MSLLGRSISSRYKCQPHAPPVHLHTRLCRAAAASQGSSPARQLWADILGHWTKDLAASDSMDGAVALSQLHPLMKQATRLIRGLDIKQEGQCFVLEVISLASWLKVAERYPLNGDKASLPRRDLRLGVMSGSFAQGAAGQVVLHIEWGDPVRGSGTDVMTATSVGTLQVDSVVRVGGREERFRSVYFRRR